MGMRKFIGSLVIKVLGWKIDRNIPKEVFGKCVVIAAPHTSNWDFPIAIYGMKALGVNLRYTIKRSWMRFPTGWFFKILGGIGVDRRPQTEGGEKLNLVDAIAALFDKYKQLTVIVQAEGTRSLRTKWKTGFYYIAKKAKVPIALGYLDYKKKIAGIGKLIWPSENMEKDMREIMEFYKDIPPKHPELFALDERYYP